MADPEECYVEWYLEPGHDDGVYNVRPRDIQLATNRYGTSYHKALKNADVTREYRNYIPDDPDVFTFAELRDDLRDILQPTDGLLPGEVLAARHKLCRISADTFKDCTAPAIAVAIFNDINIGFFGNLLKGEVTVIDAWIANPNSQDGRHKMGAVTLADLIYASRTAIVINRHHYPAHNRNPVDHFRCLFASLIHEMVHVLLWHMCGERVMKAIDGMHGEFFVEMHGMIRSAIHDTELLRWDLPIEEKRHTFRCPCPSSGR